MDMWEAIAIIAIMLGGVAMVLIISIIDAKGPRTPKDDWPETPTWTYTRSPVEKNEDTPKNDD